MPREDVINNDKPTVRVIVLGSTGSIGTNTLTVINHLNNLSQTDKHYQIVGLAAGTDAKLLQIQALRFNCKNIALANPSPDVSDSDFSGKFLTGQNAAQTLVEETDCDLIVGAIVGIAGLSAVTTGIRKGCDIALANKETLVAAGEIVIPLAEKFDSAILPVDSEHSAIFQCLQSKTNHHEPGNDAIRNIILTASGGPFRTWSARRTANATVEETLNHPTWNMGAKVTVDSASLTNKALEMIEAHHLFGVRNDRIQVLIHPQSLLHGMVEFIDGSVMAQIGSPDMRTPIQYALTYPTRPLGCSTTIDWKTFTKLEFQPPDVDRFAALNLGRRVIDQGGSSGTIFNAANEIAVAAFLQGEIPFGSITKLAENALDKIPVHPVTSLEDVMEIDTLTRSITTELINTIPTRTIITH